MPKYYFLFGSCMKPIFIFFIAFLACFHAKAQFINGYARVTNISGTTLTLSNVDEVSDTFEDGEQIILMQMQGNVIGNTTNTANFGDLGSIGSVGLYEVCTIFFHTESAGLPTTITVVSSLRNTYTTNANSSVQIITYPKFGSPNFTTTANMQARGWNGNVGGVIAFQVDGILTLAHNITADGAGFRGGSRSVNYYPGGTTCDGSYYIATSNHTNNGAKGESIYRTTTIDYDYARGKNLNGGGGGNALINAGGAGGGNFRAGGNGGIGWNNTPTGCSPSAGGLGGIGLELQYTASRAFMGGGGGGGQQNDTQASNGGNGGGIVLLRANSIRTTGTCGLVISANGTNASDGGNDGKGGGGAAGNIILEVSNWNIVATCPLTVRANGGNGGNVNSSLHGGGGGGGQGSVRYSSAIPTTNVTTTTTAGTGGCNDSGCTSRAANATGPNNAGIAGLVRTPLPMQLVYFGGELQQDIVVLKWEVVRFVPILLFEIERTSDGLHWETIGNREPSSQLLEYEYIDNQLFAGTVYYRLKQIGMGQEVAYSNIVPISRKITAEQVSLYPNPASQKAFIDLPTQEPCLLKCLNVLGQYVPIAYIQKDKQVQIHLQNMPKGVYQIQIQVLGQTLLKQLVVQ
jgi:hypothetical protein